MMNIVQTKQRMQNIWLEINKGLDYYKNGFHKIIKKL